VVCELLKRRFNRGRDNRLMFFRDRGGLEADVLYPLGPRLLPIEIKAGRTLQSEWFSPARKIAGLSEQFMDTCLVVYGGDEIQRRTSGAACGLWQMADIIDEIEAGQK
jgi:uncharacterized protein